PVARQDAEWKDDVADIPERRILRTVKAFRCRPCNADRFQIFRSGEAEPGRDTRITGIAPVGLPARVEANFDAAAEDLFAAIVRWRPGDQPDGGTSPAVPWRCVRRPCRRSGAGAEHQNGAKTCKK